MPSGNSEPEFYWTDMTDSAWQAENAPWSAAWIATLARNTECHKRAMYGTGSYIGDVGHDHRGSEDGHLAACAAPNLIQSACPSLTVGAQYSTGIDFLWLSSGWDISQRLSGWWGGVVFGADDRSVEGGTTGGWLSQRLFTFNQGNQSRMIGEGGDMVASFFARLTASGADRGALQFGLSGENNSAQSIDPEGDTSIEGPGDFGPFSSGVVHYTDLATSWKRYYVRITNAGNGLNGDMRLSMTTAQSFKERVQATGFSLTQGSRLMPWAPCPGDVPQGNTAWGHSGWFNMPGDIPLFDWQIAMTDAVELVTV